MNALGRCGCECLWDAVASLRQQHFFLRNKHHREKTDLRLWTEMPSFRRKNIEREERPSLMRGGAAIDNRQDVRGRDYSLIKKHFLFFNYPRFPILRAVIVKANRSSRPDSLWASSRPKEFGYTRNTFIGALPSESVGILPLIHSNRLVPQRPGRKKSKKKALSFCIFLLKDAH